MDKKQRGIIIGSLIIFIGIIILLANLDILNVSGDISAGTIFLLIGIALLSFFYSDRSKFYLLILGGVFCTIGFTVVIHSLRMIPYHLRDNLSWAVFIWGLATTFLAIFRHQRSHWWSTILAGFLYVIGLVIFIDAVFWIDAGNLWVIFLGGTGLALGIGYLKSETKQSARWAKYLAAIFGLLALVVLYFHNEHYSIIRFILPALLILVGGYYIYNGLNTENDQ